MKTIEEKKDNHLRSNIRLLGRILGETLKEQVSEEFFFLVEEVRNLSKKATNDREANKNLQTLLNSLKSEDLLLCARSFTHFLNLANICEAFNDMQTINSHDEKAGIYGHRLEKMILKLLKQGISKENILKTISEMKIELVLTAHPTEIKRRTLIKFYRELSNILKEIYDSSSKFGRQELINKLRDFIVIIWKTDEIRRTKPTPIEESRWGFAVVEDTLWDAIPRYCDIIDKICIKHLGQRLSLHISPVKLGSWMGGDRDGNPFVTHKTTRDVCLYSQVTICDFYLKSLDNISYHLAISDCNNALKKFTGITHQPYRVFIKKIIEEIKEIRNNLNKKFQGLDYKKDLILEKEKFLEKIILCYNSLVECKANKLADKFILPLIRQINCFGSSVFKIDIRQDSERHSKLIDAITKHLGIGSYSEWPEKQKLEFLEKEYENPRPILPLNIKLNEDDQEVLDTFKTIAKINQNLLGSYIISMANSASDILAVLLLQKEANINPPLKISPLFEKLDALNNSKEIIETLFKNKAYYNVIQGVQEVMIGYSDSGKDAGNLAANWALYKAQAELVKIAEKYNVELTLFHGRGGSVGRGGWSVEHALLSQPPGTVKGRIKITEQGEVIQQKYATLNNACHNLILYVTTVLRATLSPPPIPSKKWIDLMEKLTKVSQQEYNAIVRKDPIFIQYFRSITPEHALNKLRIGSRPAKRKQQGGIETLRAIPWVFAWTQIRLMLPVWLGTDAAFDKYFKRYEKVIREMVEEWPFFRSMINMLAMVMQKADPSITFYYEDLLATSQQEKDFGEVLRGKLKNTKSYIFELVKNLPEYKKLDDLYKVVKTRKPYTDILNLIQANVMKRIQSDEDNEILEETLRITIGGISAAMKNTG